MLQLLLLEKVLLVLILLMLLLMNTGSGRMVGRDDASSSCMIVGVCEVVEDVHPVLM